jgi:hypothetical protein
MLDLAQGQQATVEDSSPPSKRAITGLPAAGDSPGSGGVGSTLAGMVSGNGWIYASQPDPIAAQRLALCPPALVHDPG